MGEPQIATDWPQMAGRYFCAAYLRLSAAICVYLRLSAAHLRLSAAICVYLRLSASICVHLRLICGYLRLSAASGSYSPPPVDKSSTVVATTDPPAIVP